VAKGAADVMARSPADLARRVLRRPEPGPQRIEAPPALLELARDGVVPLDADAAPPGSAGRLRIAVVVPQFRRGSGGHSTIMHLLRGLAERGHSCSVWIEDGDGTHAAQDPAEVEALFRDWFGASAIDVHASFAAWTGADVVLATGWQTVHRVLRLDGARARAYLVQDHEPEFYGTSAERVWAEQTYAFGLPCIAASPWLAGLLAEEYEASADSFDLGIDHAVYHPMSDVERRTDTVAFYARAVTPRRAVPLGLLALRELTARRPQTRVVLFGEAREIAAGFEHEHMGVLSGDELAALYNEATVGLVLSMTNPSLVPTEMLACGLPVVDLASDAMLQTFGDDGPVALADFDPVALADTLARLLDDAAERELRCAAGLALAATRTWSAAAEQVERALKGLVER
jgi:glycosyltransferase involved in cell wall biosynthesis